MKKWAIMYTYGDDSPVFQKFASRELCRIHLARKYAKLSESEDEDISGVYYEDDYLSFNRNGEKTEIKIVEIA